MLVEWVPIRCGPQLVPSHGLTREPSYGMAQSLPPVEPAEEIERLRIDFVWDIWDQFLTPQRWQLGCSQLSKREILRISEMFGIFSSKNPDVWR